MKNSLSPHLAWLSLSLLQADAATVTFVVGDGFELDGSDVFTGDNPQNGPARDAGTNATEVSSVFDIGSQSFLDPFSGDDTFDPISVGDISFSNGIFRGGLTFDLSNLALSTAGGAPLQVTQIELFLEVSGATFTDGVGNNGQDFSVNIEVFANNNIMGTLGIPDSTFSINSSQSNLNGQFFTPISLNAPDTLLDLNNDTSFSIVLATDNETNPNSGAVFGSGLPEGISPNGGNFGTQSINVAPVLRITAITIPEPTTFTLAGSFGLALLFRRKR